MDATLFKVHYAGRVIGHVELGPPDARGIRCGTLVPIRAYLDARPALRRMFDGVEAMMGWRGEDIEHELLARQTALRAGGLSLADSSGTLVPTSQLWVMDLVPADVEAELVLSAPLIHVGAMFDEFTAVRLRGS